MKYKQQSGEFMTQKEVDSIRRNWLYWKMATRWLRVSGFLVTPSPFLEIDSEKFKDDKNDLNLLD